MPKKKPLTSYKKPKNNPLEVQEKEIQSVLDKMEQFRSDILMLSQAKVAEKVALSQNVVHRVGKGRGSIPSLVNILYYYYLAQGLDLNSLFDFDQEIKFDASAGNSLKKINYKTEKGFFFRKLENFRKIVIKYTQLKVCEDLSFTQNLMHRLEKGSGSIPAFLKLIIYYQKIHGLNVISAFNKNDSVTTDPDRLSFMNPI